VHPKSLAAPIRQKKKLPTKLRTTWRAHENPGSDEEKGDDERIPVARRALQRALQGVWNLRA
jgi:hypothetical protein